MRIDFVRIDLVGVDLVAPNRGQDQLSGDQLISRSVRHNIFVYLWKLRVDQ